MNPILRSTAVGLGFALVAGLSFAQASGLTRTMVTKADVSVPNHEAVVARVEVAPGATAGWHTHPGDEISYIMEGEGEILHVAEDPAKGKRSFEIDGDTGQIVDEKYTAVPTPFVIERKGTTPGKLALTFDDGIALAGQHIDHEPALVAMLAKLVDLHPELYNWLEKSMPPAAVVAVKRSSSRRAAARCRGQIGRAHV